MNTAKEIEPPNANEKEAELIGLIRLRDENALKNLYCIYYSRLHRFVSRINGGIQVDEIINDVMYVVWQKADSYNQSCLPSTWIFGIAFNKARQSVRSIVNDKEDSLDTIADDNPQLGTLDAGLQQLENGDLLNMAFKSLSPEQSAVVELTYFHGMSYKEIAALMDCSENTIKTRMFHARIKLAKALQTAGDGEFQSPLA